jgi:type IX secretion system PorP/SprF family membrane protein
MKKIAALLIIFIIAQSAGAQLLPLNTEYHVNKFLVNPSFAGMNQTTSLLLTSRYQWAGVDQSPKMQTFSIDSRVQRKGIYDHTGKVLRSRNFLNSGRFAWGAFVFNDLNSPFRRTGIQVGAAYHRPAGTGKRNNFSMGASLSLTQFHINESELNPLDPDPALSMNKENVFTPNINLGITYYSQNYYAGISVIHTIPFIIKTNGETKGEQTSRQFYLLAGYTFRPGKLVSLEPQLLIKNTPMDADISLKLLYDKRYSLTMMYQSMNNMVTCMQIKWNRYLIGYAYEYAFGEIRNYSAGSHLFMVSYVLKEKKPENRASDKQNNMSLP